MPDFPWEAFMQAAQARNKNKMVGPELIGQGLATAGQIGGDVLKRRAQQQQQQQMKDWLNKMAASSAPQQQTMNVQGRPNTPIASYDPQSNQTTPSMTQGNPGLASLYSGLASAPSEVRQDALPKIFEQAFKGSSGFTGSSKPPGSYWVNPTDPTDISPVQKPGYIEYKTSAADAGSKVTGAAQSKLRTSVMTGRVEAWNRSIDVKQIDEIAKSTGFTPKMISSIQNTATRGLRAIEVLSKRNVTWQELAAAGVDYAGIMQGGSPHVGEVVNATFPNWHREAAQWQTYIDGEVPENVPNAIRIKMLDMVSGVVAIDNKFIQASNKFQKKMIGPTIRGGLGQGRGQAIDEIQKAMTGSGQNNNSGWSIEPVPQ